jgi:uncharacterized protein YdhG (YjbR/CyaY superfamily)
MESSETQPTTIDEYIAGYPADMQEILREVRETIRQAAPEATEAMAYGLPTFRLEGNLVHFGAHPKHIGFYPTPSGITAFEEELAGYKRAKGSVQFPLTEPIPYELIGRITRYRVAENVALAEAKAQAKAQVARRRKK